MVLIKNKIFYLGSLMLKVILKFAFASLLIGWLIQSGKLDFKLVAKAFENPGLMAICALLIALQILIGATRWRLILMTKAEKRLRLRDVLPVSWIGQFFNTFLPGAVTGDFIKLLYAKDLDSSLSRTFLVTSALMDRIIGLVGLLFIMGTATLLNYSRLSSFSPEMARLMQFNAFLFLGGFCFILSLMLPARVQKVFLKFIRKIPLVGQKFHKLFFEVWAFGRNKMTIFFCVLLSVITQFFGVFAFWLISSPFFSKEILVSDIFSIVPIGQITIAIPISPSGLGVGHFIFDKLFSYVGQSGGASFFNLFFILMVGINLLGFFPYVLNKKQHSLKEAEDFEEKERVEEQSIIRASID